MIHFDRAKEEADQLGLDLYETSAYIGANIDQIFITLVQKIKQEHDYMFLIDPGDHSLSRIPC